jgi:hypothetical protein
VTELHLDSDEWETILISLEAILETAQENPRSAPNYIKHLEAIIQKIDIALDAEHR